MEASDTPARATNLLRRTADLVAIPSLSHHEDAIADRVEEQLRSMRNFEVHRIGDNVVGRTTRAHRSRLIFAGHLDTVAPADGNERPRIDGDTLWGVGSADMKGGIAVMLELASMADESIYDLTFVFYTAEEVAREHNGLLAVARAAPALLEGDAAVLCEPTGAVIEAGCQGVVKLAVTVGGERAHTARPWMGNNAIHRLGPVLNRLAAYEPRRPEIDGCQYHESLEAVSLSGGVAGNVVPDQATVVVSHRFAPDRDATTAQRSVVALLEPVLDRDQGDHVERVDFAPAALPNLDNPLLSDLLAVTDAPPRAKLGWTDVVFFSERGVPAVNFGPGDPELAHRSDERVEGQSLERSLDLLRRWVGGLGRPGV